MVDNFGSYLKSERELRGVPLEEISTTTKIPIRFLQALENNQFDELPGEVFIRGYIRSFAQAIGFDGDEMISAYDETIIKPSTSSKNKNNLIENQNSENKNSLLGLPFPHTITFFSLFSFAFTNLFIKPGIT